MIKYLIFIIVIYLIYLLDYKQTPIKQIFNKLLKGGEKFYIQNKPIIDINQALNDINSMRGYKNIGKIIKTINYRKGTINSKLIKCLKNELMPFIDQLNQNTRNKIKFHDFDSIQVLKDSSNNKKYIIEFFVHSFTNFIEIKMGAQLIVFSDQTRHLNYIKIIPGSNLYHTNYPKSTVIFSEDSKINDIKNKDSKNKDSKNIDGEYYSKLSQSKYECSDCNTIPEKSEIRNKWYNIPEVNKLKNEGYNGLPCRKIYNIWDNQGVQLIERSRNKCIGVNSSTIKRDIVGTYNPTVTTIDKKNENLHDMFKLSRGIPSNRQNIRLN
jgi:hypothetical protein